VASTAGVEAGAVTVPTAVVASPAATSEGSGTPSPSVPADGAPPAGQGQGSATNQVAQGSASATQEQPINLVISVRINSPGDNGSITQTNVVIADGGGSNTASTSQTTPAGGASGQDASTDQQAGASATATQDAAGNIVVVVRINSPGNNGPVSQTNASLADSQAQNSSGTTQGQPAQAPAPSSVPTKAATPTRPSRRQHRNAAPASTRQETAAPPAVTTPTTPATPSLASQGSGSTAQGAVRPHHHRQAASRRAEHRGRAAATGPAGRFARASSLGTAVGNARDLLGTVAPDATLGPARRPSDVSSAVLFSLLGALAIGAAFVGWSLGPDWLRRKRLPTTLPR
jgi:hypothetical protein